MKRKSIYLNEYKPPCKDCKDRHTACHDSCDKYKEYVRKNAEINKKKREENTSAFEMDSGWSYTRKR